MITAEQLKDVVARVDALHHYLGIDKKKIEANIKNLGPDEVHIKLFTDVKAVIKVNVVAK